MLSVENACLVHTLRQSFSKRKTRKQDVSLTYMRAATNGKPTEAYSLRNKQKRITCGLVDVVEVAKLMNSSYCDVGHFLHQRVRGSCAEKRYMYYISVRQHYFLHCLHPTFVQNKHIIVQTHIHKHMHTHTRFSFLHLSNVVFLK